MRQKLLLLTAVTLCGYGAVQAQTYPKPRLVEKVVRQGDELVIPYEKYVYPNGLTLILHEDHSDPIVHVDVTYHVGSAREEIGKSGFAHFFEHMMFQGSDNVGDEQHFKIVTEAGGTLNGTTSQDRTNYFQTVPSNQLEKMLWLEADRMGFLLDAVTQQKFEIQRETVKNERGERIDNVPYGLAFETLSKSLFPYGHPYSWLPIGYIEDLNRVDVNDLKNFFLRWYGPNNAVLTVGGDIDVKQVTEWVGKYFGSIPRGPEVKNMPPMNPPLHKHRFVSYTDNYARLPMMLRAYPTVPNYHPDMPALACLAQILGQGNNSVLYQQLTKKQLALQAGGFSMLNELAGMFIFQVIPYPGKSLADMYHLMDNALDSFEARGVTDDDIAKFKGGYESQLINGLQSVSGKVSQLAAFQTFTGNPNMIGKLLSMYQGVTKEDVLRVYNKYIKHQHNVTVSVLPKNQEKLAVGENNFQIDQKGYVAPDYGYEGLVYNKPKDNFDRSKMPPNGPNPVVKVPAFWKKEWPNGVKIIGTENTEVPTVNLSIRIPGGHLINTNNLSKIGVPAMFANMMNEDTENFTSEELSRELQKLGSSISVSDGTEDIIFNVQSQVKNLDATLKLLEERMFRPKFNQDDLDRLKKQTLEAFKMAKTEPSSIADEVYGKLNFGRDHILGLSTDGTEETVKTITLEDIKNYYANYMTSQNARVVVVGDISEDEVLPKLSFLNKLPNKKIEIPAIPAVAPVEKTKIYLVDVPKSAQTEFRVGYVTGLKFDATGEYYKAGLMNYTLGAAFNSRLNLNLREDKGWTYGARSSFSGGKRTGEFTFSSGIRANATDSALIEIMKELKGYVENGISDDEIKFLKSAIGQRDALRYETGFQKAGFIGQILEYDLPGDFTDQQAKIVSGITKSDIDALAKKWLKTENMNILVVGDKEKILPGLEKLGYEIVFLDADGNVMEKKAF